MRLSWLLAVSAGAALCCGPAHANLITNGGFEAGNTGFTSGYVFSPGNLGPPRVYDVLTNPNNDHPAFSTLAPHGGTLQMVINGSTLGNVNVWAQSGIGVTAGTNYFFSAWVASVFLADAAQLRFSINGVQIGADFAATLDGAYHQFFASWFSGADTTASLALVNLNTAFGGNDFAIDDLVLDVTAPTEGTSVGGTTGPSVATPEPGTLVLLCAGLAALAARRRRRRV